MFIVAITANVLSAENNHKRSHHAHVFEQLLWFGKAVICLYTTLRISSSSGLRQV
jgi:hypothetical protein